MAGYLVRQFACPKAVINPISNRAQHRATALLLLACAKSHMLSASRRQPHLLHVSAVDCRQTWSMDKS